MMTIIMTTGHTDDFVVILKHNNKILVFSPKEEARKRNALQKITVNIVLLYYDMRDAESETQRCVAASFVLV